MAGELRVMTPRSSSTLPGSFVGLSSHICGQDTTVNAILAASHAVSRPKLMSGVSRGQVSNRRSLPVERLNPSPTSFIRVETKRVSITWTVCLPLIFAEFCRWQCGAQDLRQYCKYRQSGENLYPVRVISQQQSGSDAGCKIS